MDSCIGRKLRHNLDPHADDEARGFCSVLQTPQRVSVAAFACLWPLLHAFVPTTEGVIITRRRGPERRAALEADVLEERANATAKGPAYGPGAAGAAGLLSPRKTQVDDSAE